MNAKRTVFAAAVNALVITAFLGEAPAQTRSALDLDRSALEQIEDDSESLANQLLDLSVELRRQDLAKAAKYFPEELEATLFPTPSDTVQDDIKWIRRHGWELDTVAKPTDRVGFVQSIEGFLSHFTEIEDVRLKVKGAEFDGGTPTRGEGRVFFFVVGRDQEGRREWVRGWVQLRVERVPEDFWRVRNWSFESLESMLSEEDLFSDVTRPAGLWEDVPAFGEPPNDGFKAHGPAVGDVNGDGLLDIVTSGVLGNRLFLNEREGPFHDASDETLVGYSRDGTGALLLDYDNDGDMDIFFAAVGEQSLLQNQLRPTGELRFLDVSSAAGVDHRAVGFSAAAADVNGDGWTDIYVTSYNLYGQVMPDSWSRASNGTPNLLFINQGNGRFREEGAKWGIDDGRWGYAAAFADVNTDGRQDLYVANDFGENALFVNYGDHFRDEAVQRGVVDPGNGMGVSFGDYDNDGDLDLHVTNMSSTAGNRILKRLMPDATPDGAVLKKLAAGNSLFENQGDGTFKNVAPHAGGFSNGWAWGGGFFDFDNDGWEDTFSVNGFVSGKTMKDT